MKKVLVAMSGGVDSSVAAALLQRDFEAVGITLKLYSPDTDTACGSSADIEDAKRVAEHLGMSHTVLPFGERFREMVIDRFCAAYIRGETPNPCIDCNRFIKFAALFDRVKSGDCDYVATGHYVRRVWDEQTGKFQLKKGLDDSKDQSYVLYALTQEQLAHTLFPLGDYSKEQIRTMAMEQGLVNADKPDSQDICFVPDGDYAAFIERDTGKRFEPGEFRLLDGTVLGQHSGMIRYTVGQRKGLGVSYKEPLYVVEKNMDANAVLLGRNEDLFFSAFFADQVNWIDGENLTAPRQVMVRTRYKQKEHTATVYPREGGVYVELDEPQRAITAGQAAVFYAGDTVLGGGTIRRVLRKGETL